MASEARSALIDYFRERRDAEDEAMRAYWAGRIDGHCLQNAIDFGELDQAALLAGCRIDWPTPLEIGYRPAVTDLRTAK